MPGHGGMCFSSTRTQLVVYLQLTLHQGVIRVHSHVIILLQAIGVFYSRGGFHMAHL